MRSALRSRVERLEVVAEPKKPQRFRSGYLKTLPADYVGERHVVIVKREPAGAPNGEWCEFEERPGPVPVDAQEDQDCTTIYIVCRDLVNPRVTEAAPDEIRCENKPMHHRLHWRLKALEKWLPDETKPHKALLPECLMEDLRQQGIRFDASGLPGKGSIEAKGPPQIEPATPAPSRASHRAARSVATRPPKEYV
jgi:hypothetical protein